MKKDIYKNINELLGSEENGSYDDIINLKRPSYSEHPKMSLHDRAAQFAPFAALTGYEDAISEEGRLTKMKKEISDEERRKINAELQKLLTLVKEYKYGVKCFKSQSVNIERPTVRVEYFVPDEKKSGGSYVKDELRIREVDLNNKTIITEDDKFIRIEDIIGIAVIENLQM